MNVSECNGPLSRQAVGCAVTDTPSEVLNILAYEMGSINRAWIYSHRSLGTGSSLELGYRAEARMGIADTITMLRQLCELWGFEYQELLDLGQQRFEERMQECGTGRI